MATSIPLLALLAVSLYTDLRHGRIYNRYTIPAMALGLAINALAGQGAVLSALWGMGVVLVVALTIADLAKIGAGDLKLLMAVGALKGLPFLAVAGLGAGVCGGVLALGLMAYRKRLPDTGTLALVMYMNLGTKGAWAGMLNAGKLPYTVPITAGCLIALVMRGVG